MPQTVSHTIFSKLYLLINYEDKDIKAYIKSLICDLRTDVTTNRDWMKALDEKMDRSNVKFASWFDDHDAEIDRLKERVEEQEKELDELQIRLTGAEHLIESFTHLAPEGEIYSTMLVAGSDSNSF